MNNESQDIQASMHLSKVSLKDLSFSQNLSDHHHTNKNLQEDDIDSKHFASVESIHRKTIHSTENDHSSENRLPTPFKNVPRAVIKHSNFKNSNYEGENFTLDDSDANRLKTTKLSAIDSLIPTNTLGLSNTHQRSQFNQTTNKTSTFNLTTNKTSTFNQSKQTKERKLSIAKTQKNHSKNLNSSFAEMIGGKNDLIQAKDILKGYWDENG